MCGFKDKKVQKMNNIKKIFNIINSDDVKQLVERIFSLVEEYNFDGVDITTINSCSYNTPCPYTDNQIYMIERLRTLMPYKIISYTFPKSPNNPTFSKVITQSIDNLDYVSTSIGNLLKVQARKSHKKKNKGNMSIRSLYQRASNK